jgi:hypothetical protein
LDDQRSEKTLLYIRKPARPNSDVIINKLTQDRLLTALIKYGDHSYYSVKIREKNVAQSLREGLRKLPQGGEDISKATFCFKQVEQARDAIQMEPNDNLGCDVGPVQIVLQRKDQAPHPKRARSFSQDRRCKLGHRTLIDAPSRNGAENHKCRAPEECDELTARRRRRQAPPRMRPSLNGATSSQGLAQQGHGRSRRGRSSKHCR